MDSLRLLRALPRGAEKPDPSSGSSHSNDTQQMRGLVERARPSDVVAKLQALARVESALFGSPRSTPEIGRLQLAEPLGSGAYGIVYVAYDPRLDRRVAVKLVDVPDTLATTESALLGEARALAKIEHPNVVAVYDVGLYELPASRPTSVPTRGVYIVTELIEGQSLREWSASSSRTWRDVIKVLLAAGRGLAAAHKRGIVHRDFKPSNVIVGHDGRVRVIDFGLAASHDPNDIANLRTGSHRGTASLVDPGASGTPAYMAPEQVRSGDGDQASDQYSFCVTLFEALYGKLPGGVSGGRAEHSEFIQRRVPAWLSRVLERGLDPDPAARFPNLDMLLRQLEHTPTRRRRTLWIAALGVAGLVAWPITQHALSDARGQVCRSMAEEDSKIWDDEQRNRVHQAFLASDQAFASEVFIYVNDELSRYHRGWQDLRQASCEAALVHGEQDLDAMSREMSCLERIEPRLVGLIESLSQLDTDRVAAAITTVSDLPVLSMCENLERPNDRPTNALVSAAASIETDIARAKALVHVAAYDRAQVYTEWARARALALGDSETEAHAWQATGQLASERGDFESAVKAFRQALLAAERAGQHELTVGLLIELVLLVGQRQSEPIEALWLAQQAEARLDALPPNNPLSARLHVARARALERAGRYEDALAACQEARVAADRAYGPKHPLLAEIINATGVMHDRRGHHREALIEYEAAAEIWLQHFGERHPLTARAMVNTGLMLRHLGDEAKALERLQEANEIYRRTLPSTHPSRVWAARHLARMYSKVGRVDEALALHNEAVVAIRSGQVANKPDVGQALVARARTRCEAGHVEQGLADAEQAISIHRAGDHQALLGFALAAELRCLAQQGGPVLTAHRYASIREAWGDHLPPDHPSRINLMESEAVGWLSEGRIQDAARRLKTVIEARRQRGLPPSAWSAATHHLAQANAMLPHAAANTDRSKAPR